MQFCDSVNEVFTVSTRACTMLEAKPKPKAKKDKDAKKDAKTKDKAAFA